MGNNLDQNCNSKIKFGALLKKVESKFQFDLFATGHYAVKSKRMDRQNDLLLQSPDDLKDQTFYLSGLNQDQINKSVFPIGSELRKNTKKLLA